MSDPLSGTLLGGRLKPRRVDETGRRPPMGHRFCPTHPERYIPSLNRGGLRCWLCETKDPGVFEALDALIKLGLESVSQERITPEMIERAQAKR